MTLGQFSQTFFQVRGLDGARISALMRNLSTGQKFNIATPYLSSEGAGMDCLSEPLSGAQWRKKLRILKNPCSI